MRTLLGGLAVIALGVSILPAGADIIAGDGFNYIPVGASLDGANGGSVASVGPPPTAPLGWNTTWSAGSTATVGPGLSYSRGTLNIAGIGNSVTLGDSSSTVEGGLVIQRGLASVPITGISDIWMRMLYVPGPVIGSSSDSAMPFDLFTAEGSEISLTRTLNMELETSAFTLSISDPNRSASTGDFPLDGLPGATYMFLWKLHVDPTATAPTSTSTLSMWLNPATAIEAELGTPLVSISANYLASGDNLANFAASGFGDRIDELVIGTTFGDAIISQLNDPVTAVPEVSAPVMMLIVSLPAIGVIWLRRRKPARA